MINGTNATVIEVVKYHPVPNSDQIGAVIAMVLFAILAILFMFVWIREQRILDRYRIKYSFDRELEFKETDSQKDSETRNHRVDRRHKAFLRRTYKD